jgi:transketolase
MLGVRDIPRSGKPAELMKAHGLTADAIVTAVKALVAG